jgi:hypothetical protein
MDPATIFVLVFTGIAVGILAWIEAHSRRRAKTESHTAAPAAPAGHKPENSSRRPEK